MATLWYALVALMLTVYVILDGFDLGAGALHLVAARGDGERRLVLRSIGPVWDGNEVWLLAAGGTLFYAFPLLYASSFSGFYLPLNIVLWLLVLRAVGVEFRMQLESSLWRDFFDAVFSLSSLLLVVFFGAALGNVLRGVPLGTDRFFFAPLWTNFQPGREPGVLDWYTTLAAVLAVSALSMHGALYVALKTEDALRARMGRMAKFLAPATAVLTLALLPLTLALRPELLRNYFAHPIGWIAPAAVAGGLAGVVFFHARGRDRAAFLSSCLYLTGMLGGAAFALYPTLLPSSGDPLNAITIANAAAGPESLRAGLTWWTAGMLIAVGYFVFVYRMFAGKVRAGGGGLH